MREVVDRVLKVPRELLTSPAANVETKLENDCSLTDLMMGGMLSQSLNVSGLVGASWKNSTNAVVPSTPPFSVVMIWVLGSLLVAWKARVALTRAGT